MPDIISIRGLKKYFQKIIFFYNETQLYTYKEQIWAGRGMTCLVAARVAAAAARAPAAGTAGGAASVVDLILPQLRKY